MKQRGYGSVVTKNYLAQELYLMKSLRKVDREGRFYLLCADWDPGLWNSIEQHEEPELFTLVQTSDLEDQSNFDEMSLCHTGFEYCNSLRPRMHEYLYHNNYLASGKKHC